MLATLDDYSARYPGDIDPDQIGALIADANALVKLMCGQNIETASGQIATIESVGRRRLQLPQAPVTAVASLTVDGIAWTSDRYRWDADGSVWRTDRCPWPCFAVATFTFTAGYAADDPKVQPLKALICRIVSSYVSDSTGLLSHSESAAGWSESTTFARDPLSGLRLRFDIADLQILDTFRLPLAP